MCFQRWYVAIAFLVAMTASSRADIFRWDNGQVIPGTEGITPGPGVLLDHRDLSYAALANQDLTGVRFDSANLSGADLSRANLTYANLYSSTLTQANLTDANLTDAIITDAFFYGVSLTLDQLYATANYKAKDLSGITFAGLDLSGADFTGQNLTRARFACCPPDGMILVSELTDANFTDAVVNGASFYGTQFSKEQLYSTASYKARDLRGVDISHFDLDLSGTNLSFFDLRHARFKYPNDPLLVRNAIVSGVNYLDLAAGERLVVRDDDVDDGAVILMHSLMIADGGALQLLFDADHWNSVIAFEPPRNLVQFGGTLDLTFTDDTQLATQMGRTIKVFDWIGVNPAGQFAVQGQPGTAWDTSKLYTTGEVTLLGISSDLNSDKDVDSEDLLDFLANWTGSEYPAADKTWQTGDSDEDGDVDSADMLVFLSQWTGGAAAAEAQSVASVPEPCCVGLGLVAMVGLTTSFWRRKLKR